MSTPQTSPTASPDARCHDSTQSETSDDPAILNLRAAATSQRLIVKVDRVICCLSNFSLLVEHHEAAGNVVTVFTWIADAIGMPKLAAGPWTRTRADN